MWPITIRIELTEQTPHNLKFLQKCQNAAAQRLTVEMNGYKFMVNRIYTVSGDGHPVIELSEGN